MKMQSRINIHTHKALFICNPRIECTTQPNTNLPENVLAKPKTKQPRRFHLHALLKYAGTRVEFRRETCYEHIRHIAGASRRRREFGACLCKTLKW